MENTCISDSLELDIKNRNKVVAHADCSLIENVIQIKSLYVLKKFRNKGLDEILINRILEYAAENNAAQIRIYCGPEPFCEDGQIPLEQEKSWYRSHGFLDVCGIAPCMVKNLNPGGETM